MQHTPKFLIVNKFYGIFKPAFFHLQSRMIRFYLSLFVGHDRIYIWDLRGDLWVAYAVR